MTRNEAIARCMEYELERDAYVHRIVDLEREVQSDKARIAELESTTRQDGQ